MIRVLALTMAMTVALPVTVVAAQDDRLASDVCLRVKPGAALLRKGTTENAYGLRNYSKKAIARGVRRGAIDVVGPGTLCDEERRPSVATPRDDLTDVHETRWTKLEILDGGRRMDVHFIGGVPSCWGLDRVEVTMGEEGLDVRVFVGRLPHEEVTSCILPTHAWVTRVELDERLAFGSDREDTEAESAWLREVQAVKLAAIHELSERLPGYITFVPHDFLGEDFRFTTEGRQYALQFVKNPEATKDTLVNILLKQEGLQPTFPPAPWE